jgi:hypothetical protein
VKEHKCLHCNHKIKSRYVNEFTFRLNEGNVERHTLDRLASFVDLVTGTRITYQQLKGGKTWFDADSLAQEMPR